MFRAKAEKAISMAQSTRLHMVSGEEIRDLKENPGSIDGLDKAESFRTHFGLSLNFLTGEGVVTLVRC